MITSPFAAGLAKAVAVGALMAGGAGGVYFVSTTNDGNDAAQVVAETPTAPVAETSTPAPENLDGTPSPGATATATASIWQDKTPPAPGAPMMIGGSVWVNARPLDAGTVEALINGKVCASTEMLRLPDGGAGGIFVMRVPSAASTPGCGETGSVVEFRIDGVTLDQRVEFQAGTHAPVEFTSGSTFTRITGSIT